MKQLYHEMINMVDSMFHNNIYKEKKKEKRKKKKEKRKKCVPFEKNYDFFLEKCVLW